MIHGSQIIYCTPQTYTVSHVNCTSLKLDENKSPSSRSKWQQRSSESIQKNEEHGMATTLVNKDFFSLFKSFLLPCIICLISQRIWCTKFFYLLWLFIFHLVLIFWVIYTLPSSPCCLPVHWHILFAPSPSLY